jgi:hypothetical protein
MDQLTYYIIKDDKVISTNTCPMMIFNVIIPLIFDNVFDYIKIEYNNKTYIYNKWDYSYKNDHNITEQHHEEMLSQTWFCKFAVKT